MSNKVVSVILFLVGLISAIFFIVFYNKVPIELSLVLKILPTLMMCIWMITKKINKMNWPIFIGLILSMLCDGFMVFDGSLFLILGIASNMLALIFYTIYFIFSDNSLDAERILPIAVVLGVFFFVIFDYLGSFTIPVLIYIIIYLIFMWRSTARLGDPTISVMSQNICFLGSLIITTSDCLLSFLLFNIIPDKNKYHYVVMMLWWSGLFLLMVTSESKRKRMEKLGNKIIV